MNTHIHNTADNCWGNAIQWTNTAEFDKQPLVPASRFHCVGWKTPLPAVGDTFIAEFQRSHVTFTFVEVKPCGDPPDMFFATVQPVAQIMKDPNNDL